MRNPFDPLPLLLIAALGAACSGSGGSGGGGIGGSGASSGTGASTSGGAGGSGGSSVTDAGSDAPVACSNGLVACGGDCVDFASSAAHCGGCNVSCTGGICADGICALISPPDSGSFHIEYFTIDGQYVYGTSDGALDGQIIRIPLSGGPPQSIVSGGQIDGIASDGVNLFWADYAQAAASQGKIMRSDSSGGGVTAIVQGQFGPDRVAVDAQHVYWNNVGDGTLWRADKDGQNATQLEHGWPYPNFHTRLAVNATEVFWDDGHELVRVPLSGGNPTPLQPYGDGSIAIDGSDAFWMVNSYSPDAGNGGQLIKMGLGEQTGVPLAWSNEVGFDIATDGTNVYWSLNGGTNYAIGQIEKMSVNGGPVTTLADKQASPTWIAVDANSVYWLTLSGVIFKTAK